MKLYESKKDLAVVKCYRRNHMYCIELEYIGGAEKGTVLIEKLPTKEKGNLEFKKLKKVHPDLVPIEG